MNRTIGLGLAVLALLGALGPTLHAQEGTVRGTVVDSAGKPIADADVAILRLHQLTRTDREGRFIFGKLPRGEHELVVRHIGFSPESLKVAVNDLAYSYEVTLRSDAAAIEGVTVSASEMRLRLGIEDFYRRRVRGNGGTFYTRDDILARNARRTSDVIRSTAGIRFIRTRNGSGIRFVGSDRRECIPVIFLDGQETHGMEIDDISVSDVEGIELYNGPSTTPMIFSARSSKDACGTIVVWTRIPGKS